VRPAKRKRAGTVQQCAGDPRGRSCRAPLQVRAGGKEEQRKHSEAIKKPLIDSASIALLDYIQTMGLMAVIHAIAARPGC